MLNIQLLKRLAQRKRNNLYGSRPEVFILLSFFENSYVRVLFGFLIGCLILAEDFIKSNFCAMKKATFVILDVVLASLFWDFEDFD